MSEIDDDDGEDGDAVMILNSSKIEINLISTERLDTTLIASLIASLATLNFGYAMGFPSPVQNYIEKNSKANHGFLTTEEFSWFQVRNI